MLSKKNITSLLIIIAVMVWLLCAIYTITSRHAMGLVPFSLDVFFQNVVATYLFILGCATIIGLYFLPSITASTRKHSNKNAIFVLNILMGWTVIGWVMAMVWAFTANTKTSC